MGGNTDFSYGTKSSFYNKILVIDSNKFSLHIMKSYLEGINIEFDVQKDLLSSIQMISQVMNLMYIQKMKKNLLYRLIIVDMNAFSNSDSLNSFIDAVNEMVTLHMEDNKQSRIKFPCFCLVGPNDF